MQGAGEQADLAKLDDRSAMNFEERIRNMGHISRAAARSYPESAAEAS